MNKLWNLKDIHQAVSINFDVLNGPKARLEGWSQPKQHYPMAGPSDEVHKNITKTTQF